MRSQLCFWLLAFAAGCGPAGPVTYPVSGRISFDGEPVTNGEILFEGESKDAAPDGAMIIDGVYKANVKPGSAVVRIHAAKPLKGKKGAEGQSEVMTHYIPPRYNEQSILKADITGPRELDFALTSQEKK